jgi:hypothetical protein
MDIQLAQVLIIERSILLVTGSECSNAGCPPVNSRSQLLVHNQQFKVFIMLWPISIQTAI